MHFNFERPLCRERHDVSLFGDVAGILGTGNKTAFRLRWAIMYSVVLAEKNCKEHYEWHE